MPRARSHEWRNWPPVSRMHVGCVSIFCKIPGFLVYVGNDGLVELDCVLWVMNIEIVMII